MYANTATTPGDVYGHVIHFNHDNNIVSRVEANMCYCQDNMTYDCIQDNFNPVQAGRTVFPDIETNQFKFLDCSVYQLISST